MKVRPQTPHETKKYSFVANLPLVGNSHNNKQTREKSQVVMKGIQLPVVSNNATTGHKLQGSSVDSMSTLGFTKENWAYVVLSRVRTHKGLYLRHPLDFDLRR
jgi:hypothetical protein